MDSYPTKDSATMSRIFADDFNLVGPNGKSFTKNDIIGNLSKQTITSTHIDSVAVRLITNDVGIVTAYITFTLTDNGKDVQGKNCYQDVYIKRKGQWFAVSAHVTLLSMQ
ncbi:MAG: nuclear transport factor 2 family protein [Chitinophagaceae bacterium]